MEHVLQESIEMVSNMFAVFTILFALCILLGEVKEKNDG